MVSQSGDDTKSKRTINTSVFKSCKMTTSVSGPMKKGKVHKRIWVNGFI